MTEYNNPQQGPGSEKTLFLVVGISLLILLVSQGVLSKFAKPVEPSKPPSQQGAAVPAPASAPTATIGAARRPAATPAPNIRQAAAEAETVIENDLYRIVLTNRGAQVKSWILKKYTNDQGQALEMVHPVAAAQYGDPLSLYTYDENLRKKLASGLYIASASGALNAPRSIVFEYADAETSVRKVFHFDNSYVVGIEASVVEKDLPVAAFPAWPAGFGDQTIPAAYAGSKVEWDTTEKVTRLDQKKVVGGATIPATAQLPIRWASVADPYFAAVFLPEDPPSSVIVALHNTIQVPKDPAKPGSDMENEPVLGIAVGNAAGLTRGRLFVGPKALNVLATVQTSTRAGGGNLEGLIDFGFFGIIAKPLFLWLHWTYEHWVGNWGWCILVLTIIINVALLPLRISTMKSSMKMMKLQPQIAAINEKYRKYKLTDPRMADKNREISDLYKKESVNPVGGCLPTLLQFPFLVAFYSMLGSAVELRHAHWLWIRDLSSKDPWHLIPLFFVVSMFFMQKLTPQGGIDPAQQKMMTFMMPVFLGYICWNLPSGLGIYWAAGNLLSIVQQLVMNQTSFGRAMRAQVESRARRK